jgi:hypothetical protein
MNFITILLILLSLNWVEIMNSISTKSYHHNTLFGKNIRLLQQQFLIKQKFSQLDSDGNNYFTFLFFFFNLN